MYITLAFGTGCSHACHDCQADVTYIQITDYTFIKKKKTLSHGTFFGCDENGLVFSKS